MHACKRAMVLREAVGPVLPHLHDYTTYTGFRTLKTTASQGAFPALPEKTPGYGLQEGTIAHTICDTFFTGLFRGTPSRNIPPSPAAKGIVMATP
jgi:hypothetical protein